jgi:DTW domain-containing protein YfiP
LSPVPTRTRVVFLQHPRERRMPVGTARLTHLGLPNSELHVGVSFENHARIDALLREEGVALLYPGPGSRTPAELPPGSVKTLFVIDGTWWQAQKLFKTNPALAELPRIGLNPERPGNYRIRKEPAPHCLATVEAVTQVLGQLEGEPQRFTPLVAAFDRMVDLQLGHIAARTGPRRSKKMPPQEQPRVSRALAAQRENLVILYAEGNAYACGEGEASPPEVIHWVAVRPATGERFEAVVAPRRPLGENVHFHVELPRERIEHGEPMPSALARWSAFLRPTDVYCGWGFHARDLLAAEGDAPRPLVDLRVIATNALRTRAGGTESAAEALCPELDLPQWAQGRARRRIHAMERIVAVLLAGNWKGRRGAAA